jgi:RNA polymerase sigma factor (sigma-70 family)
MNNEAVNAEDAGGKLLRLLDDDPARAEEKVRRISAKLVRFFARKGCADSENLAGDTLFRVYCAIAKDKEITSQLQTFVFGVAQNVLMEDLKKRQRAEAQFDEQSPVPEPPVAPPDQTLELEVWEQELYHICLQHCLEELKPEERELVVAYYSGGNEEGASKRQREELARQRKMKRTALRRRAMRLRVRLSDCIQRCVAERSAKQIR